MPDAPSSLGRCVCLLVDDDDLLRDYFAAHLRQRGMGVLTATDGADGLRLAIEHQPDVIVLDLNMPDVGGYEMLRSLREVSAAKGSKIVILTVNRGLAEVDWAQREGADDYLVKLVTAQALETVIRRHLEPSDPDSTPGTKRTTK